MGILGIFWAMIGLYDLRTKLMGDIASVGLSDIIWPNNPYAYVRFWLMSPSDDRMNHFVYSLSFIGSFICLADLLLWCMTAIKTPYGLLTGRELVKRKLSPKHDGFVFIVRCWSSLWPGLKIMRLREVLNYHIQFGYHVYLYVIFSLIGLVVVCHYVARGEHYFAFKNWKPTAEETGMCYQLREEWGENNITLKEKVRKVCLDIASVAGEPENTCDISKAMFRFPLGAIFTHSAISPCFQICQMLSKESIQDFLRYLDPFLGADFLLGVVVTK